MSKVICPHYARVLLQRSLPKISVDLEKLQALHKKGNVKCSICNVKVDHPSLCLKCQAPLCDLDQTCMNEHAKCHGSTDHCITVNVFSTVMACIICRCEILDFEQYGMTGNEEQFQQWINPQRLRIDYHRLFYKYDLPIIKQHRHSALLNIGNSSFINAILQVLVNFSTIQSIMQRINTEFENEQYKPKQNRKKLLRQLTYISEAFRNKQVKIINPTELVKLVSVIDPKLTGYGRKDAYDFFKFIINFLNEEFKFTNFIDINQIMSHEWDIMYKLLLNRKTPNLYRDYSFIQNIFSGELKSKIECLNCKKVSETCESYSAISLEIPESRNDNFLNKFMMGLRQRIQPNTVTLKECLDFFYEPLIDQVTQCTCGARGGKRQYFFTDQSNLLCIHIQRFLNRANKDITHVSFPTDRHDFSSYFNLPGPMLYDLHAVVVHLKRGGGDHFETILNDSGEFISIKDEIVTTVSSKYVQECEATLLFYQKVKDHKFNSIIHNLNTNNKLIQEGALQLSDQQLAFIPNFWLEQFTTLSKPPLLITSHVFCPHMQLRPDYWDFRLYFENQSAQNQSMQDDNTSFFQEKYDEKSEIMQQQSSAFLSLQSHSTALPLEICQFLSEKFGKGSPIIPKTIQTCAQCIEGAQIMSRRRKLERQLIQKYGDCSEQKQHIINEDWYKRWQFYLYNSKLQLQKNYIYGLPPPGEIDNQIIIDSSQQLLPNKKEGVHFSIISTPIWRILQSIYGGGPDLVIVQNIKPFSFNFDDQIILKEIKSLQIDYK